MLPGWDLHVLYVNGKSAVEVYKRSQGLSEYEFNHLLGLQANGSYWKKKEKAGQGEGEAGGAGEETEVAPSAFGYEMELENKAVRAKKMGSGLMFFDTKLDVMLAQMSDSDKLEKAPVSVNGF